jgi:hypothetical protein
MPCLDCDRRREALMRKMRMLRQALRVSLTKRKLPEMDGTLDDAEELPYDAVGSGDVEKKR